MTLVQTQVRMTSINILSLSYHVLPLLLCDVLYLSKGLDREFLAKAY